MKNLCLRHKLTTLGEDYHSEDMSSDSDLEKTMLYMIVR